MAETIGQGIVRNANEIGLQELTQRLIVRAAKFLTPAAPADFALENSEAGKSEAFCGGQGLVGITTGEALLDHLGSSWRLYVPTAAIVRRIRASPGSRFLAHSGNLIRPGVPTGGHPYNSSRACGFMLC
jgi:hypothetical protein